MQASLFDAQPLGFDAGFSRLERIALDESAWVDRQPGWLTGGDTLFRTLLDTLPWEQRTRHIFEQDRIEPRLTAGWHARTGRPLAPPILEAVRAALSARYRVTLDSAGFNLYRDGRDSVAWHRDTIARRVQHPVVALLSLGEPRRFLLRPRGGGYLARLSPRARRPPGHRWRRPAHLGARGAQGGPLGAPAEHRLPPRRGLGPLRGDTGG